MLPPLPQKFLHCSYNSTAVHQPSFQARRTVLDGVEIQTWLDQMDMRNPAASLKKWTAAGAAGNRLERPRPGAYLSWREVEEMEGTNGRRMERRPAKSLGHRYLRVWAPRLGECQRGTRSPAECSSYPPEPGDGPTQRVSRTPSWQK